MKIAITLLNGKILIGYYFPSGMVKIKNEEVSDKCLSDFVKNRYGSGISRITGQK